MKPYPYTHDVLTHKDGKWKIVKVQSKKCFECDSCGFIWNDTSTLMHCPKCGASMNPTIKQEKRQCK